MTGDSKLHKNLKLFDVYAISTGAMFSSGFFLLPGIAFAQAGPSVVLAYLLAGIAVLPAMLSKAELVTATPRAGACATTRRSPTPRARATPFSWNADSTGRRTAWTWPET